MSRKKWCIAPNCIFGRDTDEKPSIQDIQDAHFHRYPTNDARRQLWVSVTPIKEFSVEDVRDETYLCHLHFSPSCYLVNKADQRESRGSEFQRSKLSNVAVPTIWPNCPGYLTKQTPLPRPTVLATSSARDQAEFVKAKHQDEIHSLEGLVTKVEKHLKKMIIVAETGTITLVSISLGSPSPSIRFSVKVSDDLSFETFCCGLKQTDLHENKKLSSLTQLTKLIEELASRYDDMTLPENIEKSCRRIADRYGQ